MTCEPVKIHNPCLCKSCTDWQELMRRNMIKTHMLNTASPVVLACCLDISKKTD